MVWSMVEAGEIKDPHEFCCWKILFSLFFREKLTKRVFLSSYASKQNVIIEEINFTAKDCGVMII